MLPGKFPLIIKFVAAKILKYLIKIAIVSDIGVTQKIYILKSGINEETVQILFRRMTITLYAFTQPSLFRICSHFLVF